jgi:hypothetical protein
MTDKDNNAEELYLAGTFALSFEGQKTIQLPFDATAERVKLH